MHGGGVESDEVTEGHVDQASLVVLVSVGPLLQFKAFFLNLRVAAVQNGLDGEVECVFGVVERVDGGNDDLLFVF